MSENTHVAFDAELCAANPEAAADKIAELEYALACAGGLDRTRVILIEDLKRRLSEAQTIPSANKEPGGLCEANLRHLYKLASHSDQYSPVPVYPRELLALLANQVTT